MATATKIQLVEFNESEALNGASLAFSSDGTLSGSVKDYVLNFKTYDSGSISKKYSGQVQKKTYYFNTNGICSDGVATHNLFIVNATIEATKGTTATRGDAESEENIDIDVLQPREYFAMYALQGILAKVDNPLSLDDGQVTLITSMAFKIAQSMMSTAADYRAATQSGETPPASVDVDVNNLTSTTDKILYNMSQDINGMQEKISNMKDDFSSVKDSISSIKNSMQGIDETLNEQKDTVKKVNISAVSVSEVPVRVTNAYLNTNPSQPVSITGTVSVDNFPESGETT